MDPRIPVMKKILTNWHGRSHNRRPVEHQNIKPKDSSSLLSSKAGESARCIEVNDKTDVVHVVFNHRSGDGSIFPLAIGRLDHMHA